MNDPPRDPLPPPDADHTWVHENLAAYLAGGLDSAERARLDAHVNSCPSCFDDFTEARDADRLLQRTLAPLQPEPISPALEDRLITHFREKTMNRWMHPLARRAAYATAAAVALAATGVFANYAIHQNRLNNPLSEQLVAEADKKAPELTAPLDQLAWKLNLPAIASARNRELANTRGIVQSENQYGAGEDARGEATTRPGLDTNATMAFRFVNTPLSDVLSDVSKQYGVTVVQPQGGVSGKITFQSPTPLNRTQAQSTLNDVLVPFGYTVIESHDNNQEIWRVVSVAEAKKLKIPVREGTDPSKIPVSDELITQVMPLKNVDAVRLRSDLTPLLSADADVTANAGSNSIVVTDTAAKIHRLAEIVSKLDQQAPRVDLQSLTSNQKVQQFSNGPGGGGFGGGGFGGGGSGGGGTFAQASSAGAGQEGMRQNVDSAEHLVPAPTFAVRGTQGIAAGSGAAPAAAPQGIGAALAYGDNHTFFAQLQPSSAASGADAGFKQSEGVTKLGTGSITLDGTFNKGKSQSTWNFNGGTVVTSGANTYAGQKYTNGGQFEFGSMSGKPADISGPAPGIAIAGGGGNGATAVAGLDINGNLHGINVTNPATGYVATNGSADAPAANFRLSGGDGVKNEESQSLVGGIVSTSGEKADASKFGVISNGPAEAGKPVQVAQADAEKEKPGSERDLALGRHTTELAGESGDASRRDTQNLYAYEMPPQGTPATQPGRAPSAPPASAATAPANTSVGTPPPEQSALKIIRNGTVAFEVRSFDDAYQTISRIVSEERGFVSSTSSDKLANGKVRGTIVVRVPPEHLDRFLLEIRALGDLKAQQIAANDVTKDYYDTESELRGLRTMETRLLDLIKNGKGEVKDLIAAEAKLGETRVQIEKLEGTINYYNNLVSLATITITVYEKDIQTPTAASEQEVVNLNVETEEVETKYQNARKILDDAKARVVESQLKNADAEHVAAHIVAEVPPDAADFVANQLKQLGKVASFNRDRRQITTGGTGQPPPGVQVEKKDTRITIDLYNLANLAPRETTVLRVAVRDVEASYKNVLAAIRKDAPQAAPATAPASQPAEGPAFSRSVGRILSSNLAGQQPEQMSADIRAELRADQADAVLAAIRDSGETLTSSLATNSDNASTTSAKRGLQLQLVAIAAIPPKDATTLNIAVPDVQATYSKLLALIRADVPPPQGAPAQPNPLLPPTNGRVLNSNLSGQQPEQMVADIRAELRSDQSDAILQAIRDQTAGGGEVMNSSTAENPDQVNSTRLKRGLQVRILSVAAIPARETISLRTVAADVPDAFNKLVRSLQGLVSAGSARIISSQFNQADARNVNAMMAFEVRRDALPAVEKAIADAGIDDSFSRNIVRSTDTANTLDTKVRINIDEIKPAEALEPRRTIVLGMEVADVESAVSTLRSSLSGQPVREVDSNLSRDPSGRQTAHLVLDVPFGKAYDILNRIHDLHGTEKDNQMSVNNAVPNIPLARERIELTLTSRAAILQSDKGLWQSVRAALSSAAGALLYSVYLVLTGILFVLPFVLIVWPLWILMRRRKAAT